LIIGGSDAGISAALQARTLRAREVDPAWEVTVLVADRFPNYSICGLPFWPGGYIGLEMAEALSRRGMRVTDHRAKITHDAAIGTVDKKELETLMTRGLDEEAAVDIIVQGMLDA